MISFGVPSPKFQLHVASPEFTGDESVKVTHNGTQPACGDAVKLITGSGAMFTFVAVSNGGQLPEAGIV